MYNQDVLDLYPRVNVGAKVTVTWNKFSSEPAVASDNEDEPVAKSKARSAVKHVKRASAQQSAAAPFEWRMPE